MSETEPHVTAREYPCAVPGVRLVRLDPFDTSPAGDRLWRAFCAVEDAESARIMGDAGNVTDPAAERERLRTLSTAGHYVLALAGEAAVGAAARSPQSPDTPEVAYVSVSVEPEHRGRGVGSALLGALTAEAGRAGIHELLAELAVPAGDDRPVRFAEAAGFREYQRAVCSVLDLPLPEAFLERAQAAAARPPAGYRVETSVGVPPAAWHAGLARLRRRFSTDVPPGERDATEEAWDAARVADMHRRRQALGWTVVVCVAVEERTGELVGYTESTWDLSMPHVVHQGDTLVLREHRGHGLGAALKLAAISTVAPLCADARVHRTLNAAENAPMLRVNRDLGYRPLADAVCLRKEI